MDGAADAADVEPDPILVLGQAPMGAGDDRASHDDVDVGEVTMRPRGGDLWGWNPTGHRTVSGCRTFD